MSLQAQISEPLWRSVQSAYESEHYTHAIRDAMVFVTEVLRDKSGLDGDGPTLVGGALGFGKGQRPRVQVNKLETQTEQDIQKGLNLILSGMYSLVRNPRTHERVDDNKKTADVIIGFIDYLLGYLGESQSTFTIEGFVERVTDPYFVEADEYVSALVASVPIRKRTDTMIALLREVNWTHATKIAMVLKALMRNATDMEIDQLLNAISGKLEETTESNEVSLMRMLLPPDYWPRLSKVARFRAENILINDLEGAWYIVDSDTTISGKSATWLKGIIPFMSLRKSLAQALLLRLQDSDFDSHNYVAKHFFSELPRIFTDTADIKRCARAIAQSITAGNGFLENYLWLHSRDYPESWYGPLAEALAPLTDPDSPKWFLPDGTPLLTAIDNEEDDIPF